MARSDWFRGLETKIGIFVALIIAAIAIGWGWNYGLRNEQIYEQEARQGYSDQSENGCYQIAQPQMQGSSVGQASKISCTPSEKAKQENDNRRNYADLVAQRSSALWAKIMGIAALIGMGLSFMGVTLVWTTFRETRKANDIAIDADRPWVGFKQGVNGHLQIEQKTMRYDMSIPATNYGVRPALAVTGRIKALLDDEEIGDLNDFAKAMFVEANDEVHFATVFPGQAENIELTGTSMIDGMQAAKTQFVIAIQYLDSAAKGVFYTAEAFDMHANDASSFGRQGDVNKLLFHGQANSKNIVRFDLYKIRQIPSTVT
jgi:hypothetical protein